jgi:hypothetical protein
MNRLLYSSACCPRSWRRAWKVAAGTALSYVLLLCGFAQRSSAAIIYVTALEDAVGTGSCSLHALVRFFVGMALVP